METVLKLLVLVPHRDARRILRSWSASLFAAGLSGAWSFPWVAPLARLKHPLSAAELKLLAREMRKNLTRHGENQKKTQDFHISALCDEIQVWGPALQIELSDDFFAPVTEAVGCRISPPVLGSALVSGLVPASLPPPPQVSFRAAALANMECRFLPGRDGGFFFEWEIGALQWLPKT